MWVIAVNIYAIKISTRKLTNNLLNQKVADVLYCSLSPCLPSTGTARPGSWSWTGHRLGLCAPALCIPSFRLELLSCAHEPRVQPLLLSCFLHALSLLSCPFLHLSLFSLLERSSLFPVRDLFFCSFFTFWGFPREENSCHL